MTRKHFQKIAAIVSTIEDERIRKATALSFARWCMDENPRFRIDWFLKACESGVKIFTEGGVLYQVEVGNES